MTFIHELEEWPNFTWDMNQLASKLADVRYRQGLLLGRMAGLGFDLCNEANLTVLTTDVVKSSAIEGEHLDEQKVRSSVARQLGLYLHGMQRSSLLGIVVYIK